MSGFDESVGTVRPLQRQRCGETPMYWYIDCSSQTPYFGHPVQSAGCVARMSSIAKRRRRSASGAVVETTMPSLASVMHARTGASVPSTSTMQSPHPPMGSRSGCPHRCGTKMPAASAALRTDVPSLASISRPSIVSLMC